MEKETKKMGEKHRGAASNTAESPLCNYNTKTFPRGRHTRIIRFKTRSAEAQGHPLLAILTKGVHGGNSVEHGTKKVPTDGQHKGREDAGRDTLNTERSRSSG